MRKNILRWWIILLMMGTNMIFPGISAGKVESQDYVVFFQNQENYREKIRWLNQFGTWDPGFEVHGYNQLAACRIQGSETSLKLIFEHLQGAVFFPNYQFSSTPVKKNSTSAPSDLIPWNLTSIHADWLWNKELTGRGVHLAVLDTGVDGNHKALQDKIINFAYIDRNGAIIKEPKPYDTDTHGTHVSGIIAGGSIEKPLGVSPGSQLSVGVVIPGGSGSFSQILGGLEWVLDPDQNPDTSDTPRAVNLSLGAPGYMNIWSSILKRLLQKNILPVFSAGNDGDGISSTPGNSPLSFSVGALDQDNRIGTFSSGADHINWEDNEVTLLDYTKPDVSAPGVDIVSCIPENKYASMSGTSMAAPHLTGSIGLLAEAFPDISAYDLRAFIESSAVDMGPAGADSRYGQGKIDLKQAYMNISSSIKVTGELLPNQAISLKWRETNRDIFVNEQNQFTSYMKPGTYHLDCYYGPTRIQTFLVDNLEKPLHLKLENIPVVREMITEGRVMDAKGNPLEASIVTSMESVQTDAKGFFSVKIKQYESVFVQASGYKNESILVSKPFSFLNIKLTKADLLLMEGKNLVYSIKNPPRFEKQYYTQALDTLNVSYATIRTDQIPLTWDYIKNFSSVIAFYPSGTLNYEEGKILGKYLESGGKLIISGRIILYLEQYFGYQFIRKYFGVMSKYTISSPSVISYRDNGLFAGFFFSLTGDGGANNQEYCEILQKNEEEVQFTPLLRYTDASKESYAGISVSNGQYRGIYLAFGFEGIGHPTSRVEWMRSMLNWLHDTHQIHIQFQDDTTPHYVNIKKNNESIKEEIVQSKVISYPNFDTGEYEISLHEYGHELENFKFSMQSGDSVSIHSFPNLSKTFPTHIRFRSTQDEPIYTQLFFYQHLLSEDILNQDSMTLNLPTGQYMMKAVSSTMEPIIYQWSITDQPIEKELVFLEKKKKVLLINDSVTGDYFLDNYLRLGDFYQKYFTSVSLGVDFWNVALLGFPKKLDLLPYKVVYYFSGINQNALRNPESISMLSFYLDQGGNIILNGNCHHSNLKGTTFLKEYFGIDIYSTNIREQTVIGSSKTVMEGLSFDLVDSMIDGGIYTPYPELSIVNEDVVSLFTYLSGKISSTYYQKNRFHAVYISFGLDNTSRSNIRLDLVNKSIQLAINGMQ